jgi:hypothetical protein
MGDYRKVILEHGREYESGTKVLYSDLNFILLYYAIERIYGDYVAAATDRVPPALLEQLILGGRMVLPRGGRRGQRLVRIVQTAGGPVETASLACRFVPLVEG